jgi:hypothetical protein
MIETATQSPSPQPRNPSAGALVLFLLIALLIPVCLLVYHLILWSMEQTAIASGSQAQLEWAGLIGLAVQAVLMTGITAILWRFTTDVRFKAVYAGWLIAALIAFPALLLRLLGPNHDQLGSILQIMICIIAAFIVPRVHGITIGSKADNISLAFLLAAFGVGPFAVLGAFGSPTDAVLSLLAGLSLGWLAALLMTSTTENRFLDAFGIGAVLALLGSAIGYDGGQLILLGILPSFAFAIAALMPSRISAAILTGLLAAAGLIFFDPTELTIVLGDIFGIALMTVGLAIGIGLIVGLVALIVRSVIDAGSSAARVSITVGALLAWAVVAILFFANGNRGFHGDRLFVILNEQADLSSIRQIADIDERRTAAYQMLVQHANETQVVLRNTFDNFGVEYAPYYLVNAMEVRGGILVRLYLSTRRATKRLYHRAWMAPTSRRAVYSGM